MAEKILDQIFRDLQYSASKFSKLHKEIKGDYKFVQGDQWEDKDVEALRKQGVKALTINKIKPIIKLVTGIERQSRSDFKAFPEGDEDQIVSEIATRLLKNISKTSRADEKLSEMFKHGIIGGLCFVEPYIDYSYDLINGELKLNKVSALDIYPDPDGKEYDLSDAKFLIKISRGLTKDQLLQLFPDKESKIKKIENGTIDWDFLNTFEGHMQGLDYPPLNEGENVNEKGQIETDSYDLIDYYYRT